MLAGVVGRSPESGHSEAYLEVRQQVSVRAVPGCVHLVAQTFDEAGFHDVQVSKVVYMLEQVLDSVPDVVRTQMAEARVLCAKASQQILCDLVQHEGGQ